ncbi:hypothetical protein [Acidiphilium sp.]|uniref:hypothetical protein n=1 Tax=Acidiphilium sp. TaxID=527 RepID=UPI003D03A0B0
MTTVKSKLATNVRAAKAQIGATPAPKMVAPKMGSPEMGSDGASRTKAARKRAKPAPAPAPAAAEKAPPAAGDHASALFPSRVWPD